MPRSSMPIASGWFQGAILTFVICFGIRGSLAYMPYSGQPRIPSQIVNADGRRCSRAPTSWTE
jgi:nitric oxide reductase large subunit